MQTKDSKTDRSLRSPARLAHRITVAVILAAIAVAVAPADTPPETLRLIGTVRDFRAAQPDFDQIPLGVHTAGNIATTLGVDGRPVYTGGGYRVATQWRDVHGRAIAPNLHAPSADDGACRGVRIRNDMELITGCRIDAYDSALGPYALPGNGGLIADVRTNATTTDAVSIRGGSTLTGDLLVGAGADPASVIELGGGTITGATGSQDENFPVPVIAPPANAVVGPNVGDVWYKHAPFALTGNLHCDKLRISNDAVVTVTGNVVIYAEGDFITETGGVLIVTPGSSLDIYVDGKITIKTESTWSDPSSTRLYGLGSAEFKIETKAAFYGSIIAPDRHLQLKTEAAVHGSALLGSIKAETDSAIHVDLNGYGVGSGCTPTCVVVNDTPGVAGPADDDGIASADSFAQWFATVPATNIAFGYTITLIRGDDGVYSYANPEFFPIDGRLYGNEGEPHNGAFTYTIRGQFAYEECGGQFLEFEGGDGAWLYIDGQLVLDLGGVASPYPQRIDLDRLGLEGGVTYDIALFHAQRNPAVSTFRLTTNIPITTERFVPNVTAGYD